MSVRKHLLEEDTFKLNLKDKTKTSSPGIWEVECSRQREEPNVKVLR